LDSKVAKQLPKAQTSKHTGTENAGRKGDRGEED